MTAEKSLKAAPKVTQTAAKAAAERTTAVTGDAPTLADLSQLAAWLEGTGLEEVEVETLDYRIRLKKPSVGVALATPAPVAAPAPAAAPAAPAVETNAMTSPMVGTFYHAPTPDAPPFVKEGDTVAVGQVVGIIEAMKTMNQIVADRAGVVRKVMIGNAKPVEYGQPLMIIA